jgi:hypothetical protein
MFEAAGFNEFDPLHWQNLQHSRQRNELVIKTAAVYTRIKNH